MPTYVTIGQLAKRAGVNTSAIRYYESIGVLPQPERRNGRRRYDPDVLYLLDAISIAKRAGFTMSEIRALFQSNERGETPAVVWERLARQKLKEVEELIRRAEAMQALLKEGLRCGCLTLEECKILGPHPSVS